MWPKDVHEKIPVRIINGTLSIDAFEFRIDGIPIIDLRLSKKSAFIGDESIRRLNDIVEAFEPENVFGRVILNHLEQCRSSGEISSLVSILGVGTGLTPSGDDILVGLMAALDLTTEDVYAYQPDPAENPADFSPSSDDQGTGSPSSQLRKTFVSALPALLHTHTTVLSAQMLEAAINGIYPEPLVILAGVLADSVGGWKLAHAADEVVRLGHESGRAMLRGFVQGLEIARKSRGSYGCKAKKA